MFEGKCRSFSLALAVALPLAAGARPAGAQTVQELDSGTFELRTDDRVAARESFAIRREGSAVRAVGRVVFEEGASVPRTLEVRLQTNAAFRPTAYGMQGLGGAVTKVDGTWDGDRLRLHVVSVDGERWKEFLTRGAVGILERGVAHHYYLFFRHLPSDPGGSRASVIVPSRHEQRTATIAGGGRETVEVGGDRVEARRWDVRVEGEGTTTVWLADDGRVLRVAFPDGRVAVRQP